jgi:hypothetical protein
METNRYAEELSENDVIDVRFTKHNNILLRVAVNYRTFIDGRWHDVYRMDNHHGFLHEQKLWIDKEPRPLPAEEESLDNWTLLSTVIKRVRKEHRKYLQWFNDARERQ